MQKHNLTPEELKFLDGIAKDLLEGLFFQNTSTSPIKKTTDSESKVPEKTHKINKVYATEKWTQHATSSNKYYVFKCLVVTPGIAEDDLNVTLEQNEIHLKGKTTYRNTTHHVDLYVTTGINQSEVDTIDRIEYHVSLGITYLTMYIKKPEIHRAKIVRV